MDHTLIFWLGAIIGIFAGVLVGRMQRRLLYLMFGLLVFSTVTQSLSITFFPALAYKVATRGFFIHVSYLFAVILLISMILRPKEYKLKWTYPLLIPYILIILWSFLSWYYVFPDALPRVPGEYEEDTSVFFYIKLYPLFEIHQMLWGVFLILVVSNFVKDARSVYIAVYAVAIALILLMFAALFQRYGRGIYRVAFFDDINNFNSYLGMAGLFILPMAFAIRNTYVALLIWIATAAALISIILTVSRASLLAFMGIGALIAIVCTVRYCSYRNVFMLFLGCLMALGFIAKAANTLAERFTWEQAGADYEDRKKVYAAAVLMADEHFTGVGLGNFSAWNLSGYADRVGAEEVSIAHNIWFLTLAEIGYIGLLFFILFWLRYLQMLTYVFYKFWGEKESVYFPLMLGVTGGLLFLHFQNLVHFTMRVGSIFILSQILIALTVRMYLDARRNSLTLRKL